MDIKAMNLFLSEANIKRHIDHLNTEKLRYSILEKSVPQIKGKNSGEIVRLNIDREVKDEAISRLWYIKSHECFFCSFTERQAPSKTLVNYYPSKEKMLYDIYSDAINMDQCFLFIYKDRKGGPKWCFENKSDGAFIRYQPILALDLYEHSYFLDYGFEKKLYLRNALTYLIISSLDNGEEKGYN